MFDKLIESNSAEAEFKPRRKFFMVSSVIVGIMFLSALMISLYAQKLDLGTDDFEMATILAPVVDVPEPEQPRQQQPEASDAPRTDVPIRNQAIAQMANSTLVPDTISTTPSKFKELPPGPYRIAGGTETNGTGTDRSLVPVGTSSSGEPEPSVAAEVEKPAPPPIAKVAPKPPPVQSKGVVNGFAVYLPKPPYSPAAKAINLTGAVNVQVLIDESGNVVSAKAIDGHMLFKRDAEQAAKRAKFKPTYLGDQPVKVNGVIVYRFSK
jgi:protein TonB